MIKIFSFLFFFQNLINTKHSKLGNDERFDRENDTDIIIFEKITLENGALEKIINNVIKKQTLDKLLDDKINNVTKIQVIKRYIPEEINYSHNLTAGGLENDFNTF
jgi:hypothetical protein